MSIEIKPNNSFEHSQPLANAEGLNAAPDTREKLEGMLTADGVTEEVKAAIRKQIALMESGQDPIIPAAEGVASPVAEQATPESDTLVKGKVLADVLNGNLNLQHPYEATAQLIEQAKKQAENNKN